MPEPAEAASAAAEPTPAPSPPPHDRADPTDAIIRNGLSNGPIAQSQSTWDHLQTRLDGVEDRWNLHRYGALMRHRSREELLPHCCCRVSRAAALDVGRRPHRSAART